MQLFEFMERDQLQPDSIVLPLLAKDSSVELLDNSVHQLAESQRCAAPTCPVTMADCHLKLCTGCKVAKYCSRRCQKRACYHKSQDVVRVRGGHSPSSQGACW
jgi:hypothetical protein